MFIDFENPKGRLYRGDCQNIMKSIPDNTVDMILTDLPYGTTQNKWDCVLPFEVLWSEWWRLLKPSGVVILTAAQPFTSICVTSQIKYFRHDWIWCKSSATGHLNAKRKPMRNHEDILCFCRTSPPYFPQGLVPYGKTTRRGNNGTNFGQSGTENFQEFTNYPRSRLEFANDGKLHPTQKPVALFSYLIKTYTEENDLILDNCIGSGTTAISCIETNRRWVGIENDETHFANAQKRIKSHILK